MSRNNRKANNKTKSPSPSSGEISINSPSPKRARVEPQPFQTDENWDSPSEASGKEEVSEQEEQESDDEESTSPQGQQPQTTTSQPGSPSPSPPPSAWAKFVWGPSAITYTRLRDLARLAVPAFPKSTLPKADSKINRTTLLDILTTHCPGGPTNKELDFLANRTALARTPPSQTELRSPSPDNIADSLRDLVATLRQDLRQEMQNALAAASAKAAPTIPSDESPPPQRHSGEIFLQQAQARRSASAPATATSSAVQPSFPQQLTSNIAIPTRVGERAREAVLEGKYLPAQFYYGRPLHLASDFAPEKRTALGSSSDGESLMLVSTSSSSKSSLPLPIENEFSLVLAVNNWLLCVASLRPDIIADALLLSSDVMFFLDEYRCWQGAQSYFDELRRNRSIDGREHSIPLGQRDGFLFNKCALDTSHLHQGNRRYAGAKKSGNSSGYSTPYDNSNSASPSHKKDNYCNNWNTGKCKRGDVCPYQHRCRTCNGGHRGKDCPRGDTPPLALPTSAAAASPRTGNRPSASLDNQPSS